MKNRYHSLYEILIQVNMVSMID
uniref:Uncharacterized protein n=1 Tax=Arundo donax TaxID=35708 RepID=A0A0A9A754_ARUDO